MRVAAAIASVFQFCRKNKIHKNPENCQFWFFFGVNLFTNKLYINKLTLQREASINLQKW